MKKLQTKACKVILVLIAALVVACTEDPANLKAPSEPARTNVCNTLT